MFIIFRSDRVSNPSTDLYERIAHQFYEDLKQKLIPLSSDNLMKFKLAEICTSVAQTPAVELYSHLRSGLQREIQLVDQMPQYGYIGGAINGSGSATAGMVGGSGTLPILPGMQPTAGGNGTTAYVTNDLYTLHSLISKLNMDVNAVLTDTQQFRTNYDAFHNCFNSYNQRKAHLSPQDIQTTDMQLQEQCRMLASTRSNILVDLNRIIGTYTTIQGSVISELKNWQRNQALAGNGAPFRDNLDEIQRCIELLIEMVGKITDNINMMNMIRLDNNDDISEMISRVRQAQQLLVLSSFIVEKQPPQVMKTNTR